MQDRARSDQCQEAGAEIDERHQSFCSRGRQRAIDRPTSLAGDVYEAIFAQLMSLKIAPGARITVDSLVREFNVSQTPIREALGRLEGEGLVLKTHLIGYRAAPQITKRQLDEIYELRLRLEPTAPRRRRRVWTTRSWRCFAKRPA